MLPGLEVVSVYVSCYIFLSVVNVESWPHQILHLTVLSTNRVILLWILRPTVLSTNRVILLWILRPTVLSTIYQVMLVVIIQHNESCDSTVDSTSDCLIYYLSSYARCDHTTTNRVILRLSTVDSTSDYFPDSKLNLCMCCVIGCQLLMRKLPTPDSTSNCPSYASRTLLYMCCNHDQMWKILQLSTMLEASWTRSCIVVLLAVMI